MASPGLSLRLPRTHHRPLQHSRHRLHQRCRRPQQHPHRHQPHCAMVSRTRRTVSHSRAPRLPDRALPSAMSVLRPPTRPRPLHQQRPTPQSVRRSVVPRFVRAVLSSVVRAPVAARATLATRRLMVQVHISQTQAITRNIVTVVLCAVLDLIHSPSGPITATQKARSPPTQQTTASAVSSSSRSGSPTTGVGTCRRGTNWT